MSEENDNPKDEPESSITNVEDRVSKPEETDNETIEIDDLDISKMPPEFRRVFQAFMGSMTVRSSNSARSVLFDKFTPEHIDKYLDYIQRDDDNAYELAKTNRWFYLAYAIIGLLVFGAGVVYLQSRDPDLLRTLIEFLVLIGGGLAGGYGLAKRG